MNGKRVISVYVFVNCLFQALFIYGKMTQLLFCLRSAFNLNGIFVNIVRMTYDLLYHTWSAHGQRANQLAVLSSKWSWLNDGVQIATDSFFLSINIFTSIPAKNIYSRSRVARTHFFHTLDECFQHDCIFNSVNLSRPQILMIHGEYSLEIFQAFWYMNLGYIFMHDLVSFWCNEPINNNDGRPAYALPYCFHLSCCCCLSSFKRICKQILIFFAWPLFFSLP